MAQADDFAHTKDHPAVMFIAQAHHDLGAVALARKRPSTG
jgi:hypothetical protein